MEASLLATERRLVLLGSVFGFLSVAIGAFGAHMLKARLDATGFKAVFETGVQYQMAHSLALLFLAGLSERIIPSAKIKVVGLLFAIGIIIFSGSLYLLAVTGINLFGAITPLGGLAFMAGWIILAVSAARRES